MENAQVITPSFSVLPLDIVFYICRHLLFDVNPFPSANSERIISDLKREN
jgi:hypothetical protein